MYRDGRTTVVTARVRWIFWDRYAKGWNASDVLSFSPIRLHIGFSLPNECLMRGSMVWSWSGLEVDGVRGGQGWAEKGKGGCTMTSPPSYATMSWSGIASPQCQGWCKVVRVEVEEGCGALGCWR